MNALWKVAPIFFLIGALMGFSGGIELSIRDAQRDLGRIAAAQLEERQTWWRERDSLKQTISEQQSQLAACAPKASAAPAPDAPPSEIDRPIDNGHLLPEITQPGAKSYAEQQAEAERQRQLEQAAAAAILKALTR